MMTRVELAMLLEASEHQNADLRVRLVRYREALRDALAVMDAYAGHAGSRVDGERIQALRQLAWGDTP